MNCCIRIQSYGMFAVSVLFIRQCRNLHTYNTCRSHDVVKNMLKSMACEYAYCSQLNDVTQSTDLHCVICLLIRATQCTIVKDNNYY